MLLALLIAVLTVFDTVLVASEMMPVVWFCSCCSVAVVVLITFCPTFWMVLVALVTRFETVLANEVVVSVTELTVEVVVLTILEVVSEIAPEMAFVMDEKPKE